MKKRTRIAVSISAEALEKSGRDFFLDAITRKFGSYGITLKGNRVIDRETGEVYSLSRSAVIWRALQLSGAQLGPITFYLDKIATNAS